jgi:L-lysine 2,3-aminomutase
MSIPGLWLVETARFRAKGPRQIDEIAARYGLADGTAETVRLLSLVLPFRVNDYVLDELVDWARIPEDPLFQLVFPQHGMLPDADVAELAEVSRHGGKRELAAVVNRIRAGLNPHPSGQRELNVPAVGGAELAGLQHKYRETVLYFPGHGQSCHAYCTYCFRWAQFVGDADLRFAAPEPTEAIAYLRGHPEVSDVLFTGGDPMVMTTERLRSHLEPMLGLENLTTFRIGTKSLAYWPQRFVSDSDADDLLWLFEEVVASGRTLAVMAHFTHPREVETELAQRALTRIRATGAVVYCQAPMVAHINDDPDVLARLWRGELASGAVPYYQFVERDTGPYDYFKVPLARAAEIFQAAYRQLPGLARTVRGPVMSATPGKVAVEGEEQTADGRFLRLKFLQARDPSLVGRPFRARYSPTASWLGDLELCPSTPADIAAAVRSTT